MRRIAGVVLIGLGAFFLVLTVLFPTVVVAGSKKTPLDLDITQVSTGPAQLRDAATNQLHDVELRATRVVRTDSHASSSKSTTVNESLCVRINEGDNRPCPKDDPRVLSVTTDRVTADRRTAESVHVAKWGENVNGDTSVRHKGLSYKWPIDAKKKTYDFYLPDLEMAIPAVYEGTDKLKGLKVYKYVSATDHPYPYKVQGLFEGTLEDTRTVWVEPRTGAIIKGIEHQVQKLANGDVALDTTLTFDQDAINYQSDFAKNKIRDLKLAQLYAPIVCAVLAIAALVGGVVLLRSRRAAGGGDDGGVGPEDGPTPDWEPGFGEPRHYADSSSST